MGGDKKSATKIRSESSLRVAILHRVLKKQHIVGRFAPSHRPTDTAGTLAGIHRGESPADSESHFDQ
jgi:hypothetical protein